MEIAEYKQLITNFRPSLLQVAFRMLTNRQDAEDVVQEVFLRLWHKRAEFGQFQNKEAYCVTMTKNICIDRIRTHRYMADETLLDTKIDTQQSPEELVEELDTQETIRKIISTLPPLQRQILQLKDIEGYDTKEIMELHHMTAEAVRINLSRARKRLREAYLAYYKQDGKTKRRKD